MPLYEYECGSCQHRFEQRQKMTDAPIQVCPKCGGAVRRVIYPAGIIFKGSGWYITDSRKSDSTSSATASTDKSGAEKGGETVAATKTTTDGAKSEASGSSTSSSTEASPSSKSSTTS